MDRAKGNFGGDGAWKSQDGNGVAGLVSSWLDRSRMESFGGVSWSPPSLPGSPPSFCSYLI